MGPAYRIETERLVLRCHEVEDHAMVSAVVRENVEHLRPWIPWASGEPRTEEERIARTRRQRGWFDLGQHFVYAMLERATGAFLGELGLHPRVGQGALELSYWIDRRREGQGLVREGAAALTRAAIELEKMRRVEIHCDPENARSAAIPARLGYVHEATLRARFAMPDGTHRGTMLWSMFADALPSSAAARVEFRAWDAAGRAMR